MSISYKDIRTTDYNIYTINGLTPDENANFAITKELLSAADAIHIHDITDITNLQTILDNKSNSDHTHNYVTSITANGTTLSSNVKLETQGNLLISAVGQKITLVAELPTESSADTIIDVADSSNLKMFVGTQAEWDAITPESGIKYIVYIHD